MDLAAQTTRSRRTAAVLASALLLGTAVGCTPHEAARRPPHGSPTGTSRPASSPTAAPVHWLAALPQGKAPAWPWLVPGRDGVAGTLHQPGGTLLRLPAAVGHVDSFARYRGGVVASDNDGGTVTWLAGSGKVVRQGRASSIPVVASQDGRHVAYVMDGTLHVGDATGTSAAEGTTRVGEQTEVVGFLAGGAALYADGDSGTPVYRITGTAAPARFGPVEHVDATCAGRSMVAGLAHHFRDELVVGYPDGTPVWSSSAWQVAAFSPDCRYVAATPLLDGEATSLAIIELSSGRVVARSAFNRQVLLAGPPVFESARAILFVADQGPEGDPSAGAAVLRLGLDGTVERATALVHPQADAPGPGIKLAAGP